MYCISAALIFSILAAPQFRLRNHSISVFTLSSVIPVSAAYLHGSLNASALVLCRSNAASMSVLHFQGKDVVSGR
jgi:hypothetical protein